MEEELGFRVTDFQMWQEVLDMDEMVEITACRSNKGRRGAIKRWPFIGWNQDILKVMLVPTAIHNRKFPEGDLITWGRTEFFLNSSMGTARRYDTMDLLLP